MNITVKTVEWIPCRIRVPDQIGTYLVSSSNGRVYLARWEGVMWGGKGKILAWMPLPEAYKIQKEGGGDG